MVFKKKEINVWKRLIVSNFWGSLNVSVLSRVNISDFSEAFSFSIIVNLSRAINVSNLLGSINLSNFQMVSKVSMILNGFRDFKWFQRY